MEKFEKFGFKLDCTNAARLRDVFGLPDERFEIIDRLTYEMKQEGDHKGAAFCKILEVLDPQSINEIVATAYYLGQEHGYYKL